MHLLTSQFWDVDEAAERGSERGQLWNRLSEKIIYLSILLLLAPSGALIAIPTYY